MVSVTLPLDLLIELAVLAAGLGGMWMLFKAELKDLRRQVDEHAPTISRVSPLETRFDSFQAEMERRFSSVERKVDEVHTLLLKAAAVSAVRT